MSSTDTADTDRAPQSFARALLERASTEESAELALAGAHALTVESSEARAFALLDALAATHEHAAALLTLAAVEVYQTAGDIAAERAAGAVGAVEGSAAR